MMKRLILGVAVVALMLSFPVPAMAGFFDDVCDVYTCTDPCSSPILPAGDLQYADQYAGTEFTFEPSTSTTCTQTISQPPEDIDYGGCVCPEDPEEVIH